MGGITSSIGLISGIDTGSLIEQLLAIEARGKTRLEERVGVIQAQKTALLDINARLLNFKNAASAFRTNNIFDSTAVTSSDEEVLLATVSGGAQPGTFNFIVKQTVSTNQLITRGYANTNTTPLGLEQISFEFDKGNLAPDTGLENLNGGTGVARGRIVITDRSNTTATIDLTDVTTLNEVVDRINSNTSVGVTASVQGDGLVITDTTGATTVNLNIADAVGSTTATELGITTATAAGATATEITGADLNQLGTSTALQTLNDGNGVIIRNGVPDLVVTARDGTVFEIDLGRINLPITDATLLEDLNNGEGITITEDTGPDPEDENPDLKVIDRDGVEHEINLSGVTTVGQLKSRFATETGGAVTIDVGLDGARFTLTDTTGGAQNLRVLGAGVNATQTATDLGILNEAGVAAATLEGSTIPSLVSQAPTATIGELIDRINNAADTLDVANGGRITASITADGKGIQITDATGGGGNLIILGAPTAGANDPNTASDLGILTDVAGVAANTVASGRLIANLNSVLVRNLNGGDGLNIPGNGALVADTPLSAFFQGAGITTNGNASSPDIQIQDRTGATYQIELDGLSTVQDLIDAFDDATSGAVTLAINGQTLVATNTSVGGSNFQIANVNGSVAANELGIVIDSPAQDVIAGNDVDLPVSTTLNITDRSGAVTNLDLTGLTSLSDIIEAINASAAGVTAALNSTGNGLQITDTTAGVSNLIITGGAASALGISTGGAGVAATDVRGSNVQLKYVSESSLLSELNYGRGVGTGTFRITDSLGATAEVNIGTDSVYLWDVISEINSRGLAINARINDNGDGILIESALDPGETPFVPLEIESLSGSAAKDLNILGTSSTISETSSIDGSYERIVDLNATDNLNDVVGKINDAGIPVSAAILNTGSGPTPYRINFTSGISGKAGNLIIDTGSVDLGIATLTEGQDAKVFFGATNPEDAFLLTSSTNTISDAIQGLTIDLLKASDDPITVNIRRDTDAIVEAADQFVVTLNDAIGRLNQYDFYDVETEERGVLLGNPTVARVREALYRTLRSAAEGVGSQYTRLRQVGITVGTEGQIAFDEEKFREAYESDPAAVENLFAAFEAQPGGIEEIAPGVTIVQNEQTVTARGFGDIFNDLLDAMTNTIDGTVTRADQGFDNQIDLLNDRIEAFDKRLEAKRLQLQRQFAAMELALAKLQEQSGSLASIVAIQ